jgi:adenylylsulfate kinase
MEVDTHSRSIAKALSWRACAMVITAIVALFLSESVIVALSIALSDSLIKIGAYYLHERAWMNIRFGRKREDPTKVAS